MILWYWLNRTNYKKLSQKLGRFYNRNPKKLRALIFWSIKFTNPLSNTNHRSPKRLKIILIIIKVFWKNKLMNLIYKNNRIGRKY